MTEFWLAGFSDCLADYSWYRLQVGKEDFEQGGRLTLRKLVPRTNHRAFPGESAVDGHFIYSAGGNNRQRGNNIYRLDTTDPERGWNILDTKMKRDRKYPNVAALDGKIYIFGGAPTSTPVPSEVYDPVTQVIQELEVDNYKEDDNYFLGVDEVLKQIIFSSYEPKYFLTRRQVDYLIFFHPGEQTWTNHKIDDNYAYEFAQISKSTHVVVGTTIYWLNQNYYMVMNAYNFVKKTYSCFEGVRRLTVGENPALILDDDNIPRTVVLVHMGGGENCFCLFWNSDEYSAEGKVIQCVGLQISNPDTDMRVSLLGKRTYSVFGTNPASMIGDVLPMYRKHDAPSREQGNVSLTRTTLEKMGLKIEWTFVAGAVALFAFCLLYKQ